jgi:hypothetical protein
MTALLIEAFCVDLSSVYREFIEGEAVATNCREERKTKNNIKTSTFRLPFFPAKDSYPPSLR